MGRCGPTSPAPAWASSSSVGMPSGTPSENRRSRHERTTPMAIATGTTTIQRHRKEVAGPLFIDASALAAELRGAIRGEVRFDAGSRALYATDGSNYRQVPIGVVIPRDVDDVVKTVDVCRRHGAPLLSRGGGTSLTGGCCNVAVVMDWSKHVNKILSID